MQKVFVLVICDPGSTNEVTSQIKQIEFVKNAEGTFGAYDIVVELEAETFEAVREVITWKIRKVDKIRTTLTLPTTEEGKISDSKF